MAGIEALHEAPFDDIRVDTAFVAGERDVPPQDSSTEQAVDERSCTGPRLGAAPRTSGRWRANGAHDPTRRSTDCTQGGCKHISGMRCSSRQSAASQTLRRSMTPLPSREKCSRRTWTSPSALKVQVIEEQALEVVSVGDASPTEFEAYASQLHRPGNGWNPNNPSFHYNPGAVSIASSPRSGILPMDLRGLVHNSTGVVQPGSTPVPARAPHVASSLALHVTCEGEPTRFPTGHLGACFS